MNRHRQLEQELAQLVDSHRQAGAKPAMSIEPIPLILLSGFLGAGKTTLVNRLLSGNHGQKIIVVVNDFGGINIDRSLIAAESEYSIELKNGCACCDLAGDLTRSLMGILDREDRPDAIVLEASGIADPRGIAQVALANRALRLDNIVTLVDAESAIGQLAQARLAPTILSQVTAADVIILNKMDCILPAQEADIRTRLAQIAPGVAIIPATHADVPAELIMGIAAQRADRADQAPGPHPFASWSVTTPHLVSARAFRDFVHRKPAGILRAKGILRMSDHPARRTVYQQVGKRWRFSRAAPWGKTTPYSELVFIGLEDELDEEWLAQEFKNCILLSEIDP